RAGAALSSAVQVHPVGLLLFPWRGLTGAFPHRRAVSRLSLLVTEEARMRIAACSIVAALAAAAVASFGVAAPSGPQILAQRAAPVATSVDVELVLAVDVSYSMDPDEQQLQREGYMAALTSRDFLHAVKQGMHGRVALTYFEWAGSHHQQIIV